MPITSPPKYVVSVLTRLELCGHRAFLVGGCVRDILMQRRPNDWDVCTSALPEEVLAIFPKSRPTGLQHGTVTVCEHGSTVEVTTFRSDGDYSDHRHPEKVRFIPDLQGDLQRRDFTMNAIALPLSGIIIDPFGGRADIKNKLIRCVGDPDVRFNEDALRMLRALRFSAVLGFSLDDELLSSIKRNAALTLALAPERICAELEKILLSDTPQLLSDVIEAGLLSGFLGDFHAPIPAKRLSVLPKNSSQRWAGFSALLLREKAISSAEEFLQAMKLPAATIHNASRGCELVINSAPRGKLGFKMLLSRNGTDCGKCAAAAADVLYCPGHMKTLLSIMSCGDCYCLKRLAVTGDDLLELGFRGPELGRELYALLDHVLEFPHDNNRELLLDLARRK
ncbi:MAG: hypothetical protein RSD48_03355 [Oscillospiraceae bacterium]